MAAANRDGAAGFMVGAAIKLDPLLSAGTARAVFVEFLVSVDGHEFDEAVFCRGKPWIPCLTPGLICFVLMAEAIIDRPGCTEKRAEEKIERVFVTADTRFLVPQQAQKVMRLC